METLETPSLTLHAANRFIRRDVPIEAINLVKSLVPILTGKPLTVKFRNAGIAFVACLLDDGRPCIISVWRLEDISTTEPCQMKVH
jgi:hypothetical protein